MIRCLRTRLSSQLIGIILHSQHSRETLLQLILGIPTVRCLAFIPLIVMECQRNHFDLLIKLVGCKGQPPETRFSLCSLTRDESRRAGLLSVYDHSHFPRASLLIILNNEI